VVGVWLVHLYTASGFVLAFLATLATIDHDYRRAFLFLWLQVLVDATDGWLARHQRVAERAPWFSGGKLDDLVDYQCYVLVPALMVWRGPLVPETWATPIACAMLVASGFGFSRLDAKTADHFFTGFPSYWNIVVLYLFELGWTAWTNALILLAFTALVFVPIRFLYPSRTPVWPILMNGLGAVWGAAILAIAWCHPDAPRWLVAASLAYPGLYFGLSLWLEYGRLSTPAVRA
jgi:phosphatidylcholine synthase